MPEFSPPGVAGDAADRAPSALTPDAIAVVLEDFRAWLTALSAPLAGEPTSAADVPPLDLHTLLGQFLAVRQEVNLQTRAVRAQQEQNAETLRQLTLALDALQQSQARGEDRPEPSSEESTRPLLKTLVEVYDALAIAGREIERMRDMVLPALEQLTATVAAPPSFWQRWFASAAAKQREQTARDSSARVRQLLASLVTGYTMSLQRLERALGQHGLEAIATAGQRFDPERMEVVEAVTGSGRPAGEVIDEVRRGYVCNGRVFRYAQVRVAK
jgi:molecular chaperone GrpE